MAAAKTGTSASAAAPSAARLKHTRELLSSLAAFSSQPSSHVLYGAAVRALLADRDSAQKQKRLDPNATEAGGLGRTLPMLLVDLGLFDRRNRSRHGEFDFSQCSAAWAHLDGLVISEYHAGLRDAQGEGLMQHICRRNFLVENGRLTRWLEALIPAGLDVNSPVLTKGSRYFGLSPLLAYATSGAPAFSLLFLLRHGALTEGRDGEPIRTANGRPPFLDLEGNSLWGVLLSRMAADQLKAVMHEFPATDWVRRNDAGQTLMELAESLALPEQALKPEEEKKMARILALLEPAHAEWLEQLGSVIEPLLCLQGRLLPPLARIVRQYLDGSGRPFEPEAEGASSKPKGKAQKYPAITQFRIPMGGGQQPLPARISLTQDVFSLRVAAANGREVSAEVTLAGGFRWRLLSFPRGAPNQQAADCLGAFAELVNRPPAGEEFLCAFKMRMLHPSGLEPKHTQWRDSSHTFTAREPDRGFPNMLQPLERAEFTFPDGCTVLELHAHLAAAGYQLNAKRRAEQNRPDREMIEEAELRA